MHSRISAPQFIPLTMTGLRQMTTNPYMDYKRQHIAANLRNPPCMASCFHGVCIKISVAEFRKFWLQKNFQIHIEFGFELLVQILFNRRQFVRSRKKKKSRSGTIHNFTYHRDSYAIKPIVTIYIWSKQICSTKAKVHNPIQIHTNQKSRSVIYRGHRFQTVNLKKLARIFQVCQEL